MSTSHEILSYIFHRKSMVPHYYRNVSGIVLVYDVGSVESFNALAKWVDESKQHNLTPSQLPMIIVGNKLDANIGDSCMEVKTKVAQRLPIFSRSFNKCTTIIKRGWQL